MLVIAQVDQPTGHVIQAETVKYIPYTAEALLRLCITRITRITRMLRDQQNVMALV